MPKKQRSEGCEIDMTPMIDVVFQLIIFFIVTMTMNKEKNEDIILEDAEHGPEIDSKQDPRTTIIEIDRRGWITMHGVPVSESRLFNMLNRKRSRLGLFPILVRGDSRTKHKDIRKVMDLCTRAGLWKINFMAVKERKVGR